MVKLNSKSVKKQKTSIFLLSIVGLIFLNIIGANLFTRIDLTEDKRYTVSEPSKDLLDTLKDIITVQVYLDGDMPAGFVKLKEATLDILDEFRIYGGDNIQYEFLNPYAITQNEKERKDLFQQLKTLGLKDYAVQENLEDATKSTVLFPGAIINYQNRQLAVNFIPEQLGVLPEMQLNNAEIQLEYSLISTFKKLISDTKPSIAWVVGHGELQGNKAKSAIELLEQNAKVDIVDLPKYKVGRLDPYSIAIIAKPDSFFTDLEKYKIDQYLMNGGKIIWFVEGVIAEMDSLYNESGSFFSANYEQNIFEDLLFGYGARVNYNIVQDLNSSYMPLMTPGYGGQQRTQLVKWPYYPLAYNLSKHPITDNISPVLIQYGGTIDTINTKRNPDVRKSILLQTSPASRTQVSPARVDLGLIRRLKMEESLYKEGKLNLAVLLEGEFNSAYKERPPSAATLASGEYGKFKERSDKTAMIIVSDGDVVRNQEIRSQEITLPLGYDRYTNQTFGNASFLQNAVDYLLDENNIISLRSKEFKLRLLNRSKIRKERTKWQFINVGLPIVIISVLGLLFVYVRKRRFATH